MESPIDNECVECDDYEVAGLIAICKVLTKILNHFDETENESCSVCVHESQLSKLSFDFGNNTLHRVIRR